MLQRTVLLACFLLISASASLQAAITLSGVTLTQTDGTFSINNLAAGATAFAPNIEGQNVGPPQPTGYGGVHTTTGVNNLVYGNTGAWLAGAPSSFVGLNLNGSYTISSIAYGRDNNAAFGDRASGLVTLQYTTVAAPNLSVADTGNATTGWQTIGTMNYTTTSANSVDYFNANRHAFNFTPVTATGVRLITAASGRGIDEIELYSAPLATPKLAPFTPVIQDERSNASGVGFVGNPITEPAGGNGGYLHANGPGTFTWTPTLSGGKVKVETSWGVAPNHSRDVDYFFDPDGSGPLPEISLLQNIDQTLFADGSPYAGVVGWSGFLTIAEGLELSPDSVFRATGTNAVNGVAPQALSTAVWRFTALPEPASIVGWFAVAVSVSIFGLRMRQHGRKSR